MKQVSVDNLKENDILAFPILSHSGTVLIHADVALTDELIERAINLGVRTVYIKDEKEGIVRENTSDSDTAREEEEYPYRLEETANNSRQIVKKILEKHIYKHNEELKIIVNEAQRILDTVIAEPEVVNNITEIRNVSTDMYTHCINVCTLSTIMALRLKMSNKQIHNIAMGAILHDIGLRYINVPYVNVSENKMTNKDAVEYKKHLDTAHCRTKNGFLTWHRRLFSFTMKELMAQDILSSIRVTGLNQKLSLFLSVMILTV